MSNRDYLAIACAAASIFWVTIFFAFGSFGYLSFLFAAGNAIVVASIYDVIKPWRRQIVNLAVADMIGALVILAVIGEQVYSRLARGTLSGFTTRELLFGLLFLLFFGLLVTKGWLTWSYARELKIAGVPREAGRLPAILQVISGALLALFAGGCTQMIGGFVIPKSSSEFAIIFLFGWLPIILGLVTVIVGIRRWVAQ